MNRVLFSGNTDEWEQALRKNPLEGVSVESCPQGLGGRVLGPGSILVLDSGTYQALTDSVQDLLHRNSLLLILSENLSESERTFLETRALACHYDGQESRESSNRNFRQLLKLAHRVQTMENRLEKYIADSFRDIVDTHLLHQQKKQIEELNKQLEQLSRTDALTHLLNRRALLEAFELEKKRALRTRWRLDHEAKPSKSKKATGTLTQHIGNFACLMVDIDHFKSVNDTYGHLAGDEVLRRFGELIKNESGLRENDIVGRYGGEEFILLLPDTNAENAMVPAERLRLGVKALSFQNADGRVFSVTISIGVAEFLPEELDIAEMINRADQALYRAKTTGRDRICIYK